MQSFANGCGFKYQLTRLNTPVVLQKREEMVIAACSSSAAPSFAKGKPAVLPSSSVVCLFVVASCSQDSYCC
ncbi:unnamed protein product [Sphagnum tenellum]